MKATIDLNTGHLIESQSDGASDEVMLANAVNMGFAAAEIRQVSEAELSVLIAARDKARRTIPEVKAAKTAEINAACAAAIVGGFASSALGAPHTYDSELEDQLNLIGAVGLNADMPYRCADAAGVKAFRLHTAAQLKQVASDGAVIKLAALEKAATLKAQVQAAADAAAVAAVAW